jgi:glycine/D-amino acid oxidase-like deaminating enzyme
MAIRSVDAIILGRGLAGAVLAETLLRQGLKVHMFDRKRPGNASMAAGGVVNPLVLRRDVPSWRAAQLLPLARGFYSDWQARLGVACWHDLSLVKVFPTPREVDQWLRAMDDPGSAPFMARRSEPEVDALPIHAPHGYGTVTQAAWLDVPALLAAQRDELLAQSALTEQEVNDRDIVHEEDHVRIGEVCGTWLVRCEGPFGKVPGAVPVKGETLIVRIPGLALTSMVHRGVFILPLGNDLFRVGATFRWDEVFAGPTEEGRQWLLEKLAAVVHAPVEVVEHTAGVRPASKDRRPVLGITAVHEALFNGLGSRGVLLAPWCSQHLADHLFRGMPLDAEVAHDRVFAGR